jgi:hypothetical protein
VKPDPIEELLLRAYPNPERKGCPGSETIQALAKQGSSPQPPGLGTRVEVFAVLC